MPAWKDRRRAQAGTTLVELLVSLMIVGLALVLVVGTFSTGLLDATVAKRNTAVQAVMQYELDQIGASPFNAAPSPYSDCFATEDVSSAPIRASFQGPCTGGAYTLRADVAVSPGPGSTQLLSVTVISLSNAAQVGNTVQVIKGPR